MYLFNTTRKMKENQPSSIPSLIKWTGSKRSQLKSISKEIPEFKRYFEPFLGGGAVLSIAAHPGAVAGDIYAPLIKLWSLIQTDPQLIVCDYEQQWTYLQTNTPDYYYTVRSRFNLNPNPLDLNFLIRTCVNGIIRFNKEGKFNNSFHLSRRGMQPTRFANTVAYWHDLIQGVKFVCQDYSETISEAKQGDFIYFDPPYAGNKMRYTDNLNIDKFFTELEELNRRNVKWALSFDGLRGTSDFSYPIPKSIYRQKLLLFSGNSPVRKVLGKNIEPVYEYLYMNY